MPRGITTPLTCEISVGTAGTQVPTAWYNIKTLLVSAGWVVESSSDATTYNATGDQWTSATSPAINSWAVLRSPAADAQGITHRFCVQVLSHSNVGLCRIKVSENAAFSGGSPSATVVPSATGEFAIRGTGTDAAPTGERMWSDATAGTNLLIGIADSSAPFGFMFHHRRTGSTTDVEEMRFGMDPLHVPSGVNHATDTSRVIWHAGAASSAWTPTGISTVSKTTGTSDPGYGKNAAGTYVGWAAMAYVNAGGTAASAEIPDQSASAGTGIIADPWSAKTPLLPIVYASDANGVKGISTLIHAVAAEYSTAIADRQIVYTVDGDASAYMRTGAYALPWNGSAPVNGTWSTGNGEIWDLTSDGQGPTITGWTPVEGATLAATDTVQVDFRDFANRLRRIVLWAEFAGATPDELVFDGLETGFGSKYTHASNASTAITNGRRLVIRRDGDGWPSAPTFHALAFDYNGNLTADDTGYAATAAPSYPSVDSFSPALGSDLGAAGAAAFTVRDAGQRLTVLAEFGGLAPDEKIYHAGAFSPTYAGTSTATPGAGDSTALSIVRDGGWPYPATTLTIRVIAEDDDGNYAEEVMAWAVTPAQPNLREVTPPTITRISPLGAVSRYTPIVVDVADETELSVVAVLAEYPDGSREIVHDGFRFGDRYLDPATNAREVLDAGLRYRFTILRIGGWRRAPKLTFIVRDAAGNVATVVP